MNDGDCDTGTCVPPDAKAALSRCGRPIRGSRATRSRRVRRKQLLLVRRPAIPRETLLSYRDVPRLRRYPIRLELNELVPKVDMSTMACEETLPGSSPVIVSDAAGVRRSLREPCRNNDELCTPSTPDPDGRAVVKRLLLCSDRIDSFVEELQAMQALKWALNDSSVNAPNPDLVCTREVWTSPSDSAGMGDVIAHPIRVRWKQPGKLTPKDVAQHLLARGCAVHGVDFPENHNDKEVRVWLINSSDRLALQGLGRLDVCNRIQECVPVFISIFYSDNRLQKCNVRGPLTVGRTGRT